MSRSTANMKRRRKKTRSKQQAVIHAAHRSAMITGQNKTVQATTFVPSMEQQPTRSAIKASLPPLTSSPAKREKINDWKPVFQQYITRCNQAETEQHSHRVSEFTLDQLHNQRLNERLARSRERDLYRGAHVAGSETKAEILSVNELEQEVVLNAKLYIKRKIAQDDQYYFEERIDQERIWLAKEKNGWKITRVEPNTPERKPRYASTTVDWGSFSEVEEEDEPIISKPYLNPDLISHFRNTSNMTRYRREQAVAYADAWWNKPNSQYEEFEANCTNYVSQCLFAGEAPMLYTNRRDSGWWYKGRQQKGKEWWSYSWAVSRSLTAFLSRARSKGLRAVEVERADQLELGDVIVYDWNGNNTFQHSTIVTAFDSKGQPLVNANTVASRHRYWDYQDSYAWTPSTRYRFFHIHDYL